MASVDQLAKPFLKWAGGKRQLISTITTHFPKKYNVYHEPFLGGGALLFAVQPKQAVINDVNSELINCYEVVKSSLLELISELKRHENDKSYYYTVRGWDRDKNYKGKTPIERAARVIFLYKTFFHGLFRVNSQGHFNVPFGSYKNPNILNVAGLEAVNKYLNECRIQMLSLDFQGAVEAARKDDFICFNPPYNPISDSAYFTNYNVNRFSRKEQLKLKKTFDNLNSQGCHILLSNAHTDFVVNLYKDYNQTKVSAIISINSNAKKRGKVDEILAKNYE